MTLTWPDDVIRPRPLRLLALWHGVSWTGIRHCREFGSTFRVWSLQARAMTELIPTVKIKTRNLVEGYFGIEFPMICNHCGVIAAW